MNEKQLSLDLIDVASPCHAAWDEMTLDASTGEKHVRRCQQCNSNVYNLSEMTRSEAEAFVAKTEGRTCVRFFRRQDGTILTRDCPVGLRAARQRLVRAAAALAGVFLTLVTGTLFGGRLGRLAPSGFRSPAQAFGQWIQPEPRYEMLIGKLIYVCPTTPPIAPAPTPIPAERTEPAESPLPEPTPEQLQEIESRLAE
jgi:hypothetical protein